MQAERGIIMIISKRNFVLALEKNPVSCKNVGKKLGKCISRWLKRNEIKKENNFYYKNW